MMRGKYLVIEGPDGAGKSTLAAALSTALFQAGVSVSGTREPGGTAIGLRIRESLKNPAIQRETPPLARRLLFEADRVAHQEWIRSKVEAGLWVVSDRCALVSNHCYGQVEGASREVLRALTALDADRLNPDLVILLDTPREQADAWLKPDGTDPVERDPDLLRQVRAEYDLLRKEVELNSSLHICRMTLPAVVLRGGDVHPGELAARALELVRSRLGAP